MSDLVAPPREQFLTEDAIRGGMDLLFFINTRHLRRADQKLAELGLGRAHHRVLYFVARKPDLTVSELLALLAVTKQSLGRVTKDLTANGLVETKIGERDRRQRLLRLTSQGAALEHDLFQGMRDNVARAYAASGADAVSGFWEFAQHLIGDDGRQQFARVQGP